MPLVLEPVAPSPPPPPIFAGATAGDLLAELGMRMGDYASGPVGVLSTDTSYLQDGTRVEPDNLFKQGWLSYTPAPSSLASANFGFEVRITGYDGTINVGRFLLGNGSSGSGLAVPAQPGDQYSVHMRWSRRRKLAAINRAIRRLPQGFWRRIEDTSILTADRIWTYTLPTGLIHLQEVQVQTSLNLSGPGILAIGTSGQGFPFYRVTGWSVRTDVSTAGVVSRVLQLGDLLPWPRVLRLIGTGIQAVLQNDTDVASVGQDDYDQRLYEYLLSYAQSYLWLEGADGAPVDQAARSVEMVKLSMQVAAELRNDLVMPYPSIETDNPDAVARHGWGDNPYYFAALHTPGPPS